MTLEEELIALEERAIRINDIVITKAQRARYYPLVSRKFKDMFDGLYAHVTFDARLVLEITADIRANAVKEVLRELEK